jgi:hypothetical protein
MATSTLLTIEDFELLPAEAAENHELVGGSWLTYPETHLGITSFATGSLL